ncbi:SubName: Full=Uncharacterized protein {ECO:0000313/EMBL:CCA74530.1} [Serendipita indica DSM 11827]|uniref:VPS62-Vacuolar Protein Sorting n=1 Tax=Serendipita indica (strain DSM 11827) TaxID=1109443 RepID=G4TT87_SERID|nr:SubName: Full=Uncharacterized protein {ECO:0000313/EMBL:CCA74530.1} [Serendipita indica DSM 11827]CCA74530.1 hypothetical protein PIIN_08482 [Serendipita indica DSM 11827]
MSTLGASEHTETAAGAGVAQNPAVASVTPTSPEKLAENKTDIPPLEAIASSSTNVNTEAIDSLPSYAIRYAPYVYLDKEERFFPGLPEEHVKSLVPRKFDGHEIPVPEELKGRLGMLALDEVNKPDTFLTMDKNLRENDLIDELTSVHCKPDETGKSKAPVWILVRDKNGVVEEKGDILDVFYFFFYPFNQGNTVLFTHFGNHVGDWEHAMIRFCDGVPQAMHLSAHSDGNSWKWAAFEKRGERPVIYAARGSHAMYPSAGKHDYSGVLLVGPSDYTSTGHLWDPTLNFVAARSIVGGVDSAEGPCGQYTSIACPSMPGLNTSYTSEEVAAVLRFQGRWGNSFSDLRLKRISQTEHQRSGSPIAGLRTLYNKVRGKAEEVSADALRAAEAGVIKGEGPAAVSEWRTRPKSTLNLKTRLLVLIWAEGPTGPRDKSLERKTMNRWKAELLE